MITSKHETLQKLLKECKETQDKWAGEAMPQSVGDALEAKLKEAETLQKELDEIQGRKDAELARARRLQAIEEKYGDVKDRLREPFSDKIEPAQTKNAQTGVAAYCTLGDFVVASQVYQEQVGGNWREKLGLKADGVTMGGRGTSMSVRVGPQGQPLVPLTREQAKAIQDAFESKAVPTIGAGVIDAQRLDVFPQATADDRLRLRDVIRVGQTMAPAVEYVREVSHTRAAAPTAAGSSKPESTVEYDLQTSNVRNIPVWMPVTTNTLDDWPRIRSLIDGRLTYDIRREEEDQILWGLGTGQNLTGLHVVAGTTNIATNGRYDSSLHNTIDVVRMGMTDVMTSGYAANALLIQPEDWEGIVISKGTDNHYLGQIFPMGDRGFRLWGLTVVESEACTEDSGEATPERRLLVGDFVRGCELIERQSITIQIGLNADDFTKNLRTILAEERVAFPIYAPAAFAYFITRAEVT